MKVLILIINSIILITLISNSIFAQSEFKDGYIITENKDTVRGFVEYTINIKNKNTCSFRETKTGKITQYNSNQIIGYGLWNLQHFISTKIIDSVIIYQGFIEILIRGEVNLLYGNRHYYLLSNSNELTELINPNKTVISPVGDLKVSTGIYKNQIKNALSYRCQNLTKRDFERLNYNHSSLINIVEKYHDCIGSKSIKLNKEFDMLQVWIGFSLVSQHTTSNFESSTGSFNGLTARPVKSNIAFSIRPSVLSQLPYVNKKINIGIEFGQFNYEHSSNFGKMITTSIGSNYTTIIEFTNRKTTTFLRYNYIRNRISLFTDVGLSVNGISNSTVIILREDISDAIVKIAKEDLRLKKREVAFCTSIGSMYNMKNRKLFLQFRHEISSGYVIPVNVASDQLKSKSTSLSINFGMLVPILNKI